MSGEMDFVQIILHSGIVVKFVLILLIAASVLSWAIIFQKNKMIKNTLKADEGFMDSFSSQSSITDELSTQSLEDSSYYPMYTKGIQEYKKATESEGSSLLDLGESLERSLKQGATISTMKLELRLSTLASISSVAPFIGLFGTVWGIIDAFSGLAQGGGSIEAVAPGIAEALIATAVGLAAAIPANWFYNSLTNKLTRIQSGMENFGQEFLNLTARSQKK